MQPMGRADITTIMCRLSQNLVASFPATFRACPGRLYLLLQNTNGFKRSITASNDIVRQIQKHRK